MEHLKVHGALGINMEHLEVHRASRINMEYFELKQSIKKKNGASVMHHYYTRCATFCTRWAIYDQDASLWCKVCHPCVPWRVPKVLRCFWWSRSNDVPSRSNDVTSMSKDVPSWLLMRFSGVRFARMLMDDSYGWCLWMMLMGDAYGRFSWMMPMDDAYEVEGSRRAPMELHD